MKFGLAFPYNSTRDIPVWAQQAEARGWDGCFLGDAVWCEDPMIALAAAAMTTRTIRLGTLIIPAPLRRPWKIASEAIALELLSGGRLILGLGSGAAWMGWQAFPGEMTDSHTRSDMLDETIAILNLLFQRKPVDYAGKYFPLALTQLDEMYYPPRPIQQPRIPLWAPLSWPRRRSKVRALMCDGLIAEKVNPDGSPAAVTPQDIREMKAFVDENRALETPFDIVMIGKTDSANPSLQREQWLDWQQAGVTWWVEDMFGASREEVSARIAQGPPAMV